MAVTLLKDDGYRNPHDVTLYRPNHYTLQQMPVDDAGAWFPQKDTATAWLNRSLDLVRSRAWA